MSIESFITRPWKRHEERSPQNSKDFIERIKRRNRNFAYGLIIASFISVEVGFKVMFEGGWHELPVAIQVDPKKSFPDSDGDIRLGNNQFLYPTDKEYSWSHKSGDNNIDTAVKKGVNVLDIDLRLVKISDSDDPEKSEELVASHGPVFSFDFFGEREYVTFDPTEMELAKTHPQTFEEVIKHIASLRARGLDIGANLDVKDLNLVSLGKIMDVHYEFPDVPFFLQPQTKENTALIEAIVARKLASLPKEKKISPKIIFLTPATTEPLPIFSSSKY